MTIDNVSKNHLGAKAVLVQKPLLHLVFLGGTTERVQHCLSYFQKMFLQIFFLSIPAWWIFLKQRAGPIIVLIKLSHCFLIHISLNTEALRGLQDCTDTPLPRSLTLSSHPVLSLSHKHTTFAPQWNITQAFSCHKDMLFPLPREFFLHLDN